MAAPILAINNLKIDYLNPDGKSAALLDVSMEIASGESVAVVGESGSGKSQTFMATMGLLDRNAQVTGSALFHGEDLLTLSRQRLDRIRGKSLSMIFQNPMTALTPTMQIGKQLIEACQRHLGLDRRGARLRSQQLLTRVGISDAEQRMRVYPHQLSGGMRQRVMIAMALLCDPELIIADEPTTALDVTIQAQVLDIFREMRRERSVSIVLITHDLGVVAETCDRVIVLYAGKVLETGKTSEILTNPQHPYTQGLLAATPQAKKGRPLLAIPGSPPLMNHLPSGCTFHPRCKQALAHCRTLEPELIYRGKKSVACHLVNKEKSKHASG